MTIDSHYYLGCGNRGGCEREVVYWVDDSMEPIVFRDDVTIKVDGGVLRSLSEQEISRGFNA